MDDRIDEVEEGLSGQIDGIVDFVVKVHKENAERIKAQERRIAELEQRGEPQPGPSGCNSSSKKVASQEQGGGKQKKKKANLVKTIDDVPSPLRELIAQYMKGDRLQPNDLLSDVQRAFVLYRLNTALATGETISSVFLKALIIEGIENGLWEEDWNPSGKDSFLLLLKDRVKNARRSIKKRVIGITGRYCQQLCSAVHGR